MLMVKYLSIILIGLCLVSCATQPLVKEIYYRSFRNSDPSKQELTSEKDIPSTSTIAISATIDYAYNVEVVVYNLTNKTMSIDRTQSFFIYPYSQKPYYDPSITTHTSTIGSSSGVGVNLGAVAGALGVGGAVGRALNGVNVGESKSQSSATTTYDIDQSIIHIPPHGHASMGKSFNIGSIINPTIDIKYNTFGVCIAYSTNRLSTLDNFISQFHMNTIIISPVRRDGKKYYVNDALRNICIFKPDLFNERCFVLDIRGDKFNEDKPLYDYK